MDAAQLAKYIDHTILSPTATDADVAELCAVANRFQVIAICVSPSRLPLTPGLLDDEVGIATVCGFPSGSHRPETKAAEAHRSIQAGATEIDMVIDLGLVKAGEWESVEAEIATVRAAVAAPARLKVIIESAALTDEEIVACCQAAEAAGADYVKTSTGFHPSGGATVEAVRLMAETVGGRLGVKASGGIRDRATTLAMIEAGATRIGASATATILAEG